jgi:hypothetical protein
MARLCMGDAVTLSRRRGEVRLMPKSSRIRPERCGGRGASLVINRSGRLSRTQRLSQRGTSGRQLLVVGGRTIGVVRSVQGDRGCGGMGAVQQFGGAA